jgi:hypothetical protein
MRSSLHDQAGIFTCPVRSLETPRPGGGTGVLMKKRYERPVVIATYAAEDLRREAALVVTASGYDWHGNSHH